VRASVQNEPGKIAEALWVTSQYPEEVEADLQRFYGLDYLDRFRPGSRLTWRKLLVLLHNLPPESALNTAMRNDMTDIELASGTSDPSNGKWSSTEIMLAALIDEVRHGNWIYVQAHSDRTVPRPSPVPRPGLPKRRGRIMSLEDAQKIDPRLRGLAEEEAQALLDRMTGRGR
jgi:hypothetical protein